MKQRFVFSIILLCVLVSVCISGCAEPMTRQMDILVDPVADPSSGEPDTPPDGMVLIPAGEFEMGSDSADAEADEQPVHTVYVDAFYMDKYEVTVGQYKAFVQATDRRAPDWNSVAVHSPTDEHPIVGVTWNDAMAYAQWVGKRLPTEIDWTPTVSGTTAGVTITLHNTEAAQIGNLVLYSGQIVFTRTTAGTGVWNTFLSLPVNRTASHAIYGDGTETERVYVATTTTMRVWTREDATTDRDTTFFGYYLITE